MDRKELKGRIRGTPVTLPTPFDKDLKVDFGRLTDMTHWWVEQGLGTDDAALKTSAAMGEGPDLNDDEWPHILRTVVNAAGPGKTVICGLKPKNTLHTIEDACPECVLEFVRVILFANNTFSCHLQTGDKMSQSPSIFVIFHCSYTSECTTRDNYPIFAPTPASG